jgi:DnaJ-domain-containing protein 1
MEDFVDRLAGLLRALLGRGSGPSPGQGKPRFVDPDVSEAWEELDEYMRSGRSAPKQEGKQSRERPRGPRVEPAEDLRQDYANLEVPFGADIEAVRKAYKILVMRYHPDKHARDPEKLRIATEITKKINESFERIRSRSEGRGGGLR